MAVCMVSYSVAGCGIIGVYANVVMKLTFSKKKLLTDANDETWYSFWPDVKMFDLAADQIRNLFHDNFF